MSSKMSNFDTQYQSKHPYKSAGTFMLAAGTLIEGVTGKILKIHQYSASIIGTFAFSLNNAKPTGGTIDFGGYLCGGVIASPASIFNKPFVPYPGYLCTTTSVGSALCLGTYNIAPNVGTVFFQAVYTDSDAA